MIRGRKILCAFIVFLILASCQYLAESCEIYKFSKREGWALVNHVIKTISRGLVETCWSECAALPECFSINVRRVFDVIFECELNNSTKQARPEELLPTPGSEYHGMVDVDSRYCSLYQCVRKQVLSDGWIQLGLKALKLFTQSKSWTDARQHCQSHGAELISITGSYKHNFVYNALAKELINTAINNKSSGAAPPTDTYWALDGHDDDVLLLQASTYANYKGKASLYIPLLSTAKVPAFHFNPEGFTIAFWVYNHRSAPHWFSTFFGDLTSGDSTFRINWGVTDEQLTFTHFTPGQTTYATIKSGKGKIPRLVWEHIAITFNKTDPARGQVFLDGSPVATSLSPNPFKSIATTKISTRTHYKIGAKKETSATKEYPFRGYMRNLMVFDRELSTDEVQNIMNWSEYGPWIGLSDDTSDQMFAWSDGMPLGQYVPLPIYKPNTPSSRSTCVAMKRNGKWINENCDQKRPFICQKPIA